ncbi:MAG: hypothetical protein A2017_02295 [Lentisphaerae bacterium GWF2_44_16]|nr:MAG: hypothetical protein A2017_02295 [Lentisphaerae bacterium GWF2_44_16]
MKTSKFYFFTIVELLVVISIIVILAGMLLPALKNARNTAKMTQCAGNLKQIGILMIQYVDENNSWYPYAYRADDTFSCWGGKIAIAGNLKQSDIFICPSVDSAKINSSLKSKTRSMEAKASDSTFGYVSYGAHRYGATPCATDTTLRPAKAINLPSDMMVAVDFEVSGQPNDGWYYSVQSAFQGSTDIPFLTRHNYRFNLLYTDGHVAPSSLAELGSAISIERPWYYKVYCK